MSKEKIKKVLKKDDIKVSNVPKGINIVIKNEVQQPPQEKIKRKRKIKRKLDINRLPKIEPSYVLPSGPDKTSYIKPQYFGTSLNRYFPQIMSPDQVQQIQAPPQLQQLTAPQQMQYLPAPPVNLNFGDMFKDALTPLQYGYRPNPIIEDITDYLPEETQQLFITKQAEKEIAPQLQALGFNQEETEQIKNDYVTSKLSTAKAREFGTKDAKALKEPLRDIYKDDQNYINTYFSKIKQIAETGKIRTGRGIENFTQAQMNKAGEILRTYDLSWTRAESTVGGAVPPSAPMPTRSTTEAAAAPPRAESTVGGAVPPPPPKAAPPKAAPPPPSDTTGAGGMDEAIKIATTLTNPDNIKIMKSITQDLKTNNPELMTKLKEAKPKGRAAIFYSYLDKMDLKSYKLPYYKNKDVRAKLYKLLKDELGD